MELALKMKKYLFLIFGTVGCLRASAQDHRGHRILLSPGKDSGLAIQYPGVLKYHPGDTLVLSSAKPWTYFTIDNYKGSPVSPLVIINDHKGIVKFVGPHEIEITNSSYIILTGTGSRDRYGFLMEGDPVYRLSAGKGIEVHMRSKNIEISHIYVHNKGFGFVCRTDNFCVDSLTYPNWILDSISIHDCRIVGIWYEGMYIGNTSPDNAKDCYDPRPIVCNGDTVYPMPMRNGYTQVYNNYVDSTGRGGIQLASASKGISEIYNNTVQHNGMNGDTDQGTGISVGAYAHVRIHDNRVNNTFTWGIASLGGSGTGYPLLIKNNKVDSSGYLIHYNLIDEKPRINSANEPSFKDTLSWPGAIYVGTRSTKFTDSTTFIIINNIVGLYKNQKASIAIYDDYRTMTSSRNVLCGNMNAGSKTGAATFVSDSKGKIIYRNKCK
jgi:hypothetical protein